MIEVKLLIDNIDYTSVAEFLVPLLAESMKNGEKGGILGDKIKWNFTKFLIDREGNVTERFGPTVKPEDIDAKIKALL